MRRLAVCGLIGVLAALGAGCGNSNTVTQIALTPTSMSLAWGQYQQLTATTENSSGTAVSAAVTYTSSNAAVANVNINGVVCAGSWDSTGVFCTPPSPLPTCTPTAPCSAIITVAASNGPKTTMSVLAHPAVAALVITSIPSSVNVANCISQGNTAYYSLTACSAASNCFPGSGNDITGQVFSDALSPAVDPFTWTVTPSAVGTTAVCGGGVTGDSCTLVTAAAPGQAQVAVSFSNAIGSGTALTVNSLPSLMTTCPMQSIVLTNTSGAITNSIASGTQALLVTAKDTTGASLATPAVQLNTSQPASSTVTISDNTGTGTEVAAGTSTFTASCTPPSCNVGMYPVYSNPYTLTVTGSSSTTVYAASQSGTTLLPINATSGTAAAAITLPAAPNSMVFAPNGSTLYLGSTPVSGSSAAAPGLMIVTISTNTVTNNSTVPGTVLAVSPDSSTVLIADGSTLNIYNSTNSTGSARQLGASGIAAAWSPDGDQAYIATTAGIAVYTTATGAVTLLNLGSVNSVDFLSQGSFAYLAGGGNDVTVLATCSNSSSGVGQVTTPPTTAPALIRSLPNALHVLTANSPNLDDIAVSEPTPNGSTTPASGTGTACSPPTVTNSNTSHSFGVGTFTPTPLANGLGANPAAFIVLPNSSKAYILASDNANVLAYDVASATPSTIALGTGATGATTGGATLDSAYVFVGVTGTNTINKITVSTGASATFATPGFEPDFVAVRP